MSVYLRLLATLLLVGGIGLAVVSTRWVLGDDPYFRAARALEREGQTDSCARADREQFEPGCRHGIAPLASWWMKATNADAAAIRTGGNGFALRPFFLH